MTIELPTTPCMLGEVRVEWGQLRLLRDGQPLRITPKAAAVLHQLLAQRGSTVTRRALFDAVWPGSYSSDEVLTQVIAELRRAFDEAARESRHIETVPKLGYRWIGPAPQPVDAELTPASTRAMPSASNMDPVRATTSRRPRVLALIGALALLAGIGWFATRSDPSTTKQSPRTTPITHEPGLDLDPDLSRDGRRVAYVHASEGRSELRVRDVGGSDFRRIALTDDGVPSAPTWSPDGRELAYVWRTAQGCELRRVALAGGEPRRIAGDCLSGLASSLDWSADGRYLVYSRLSNEAAAVGQRSVAVFRIELATGDTQRISDAHRWLVVDGHPRISPDGSEVAFVRDGDGRNHVVIAALEAPHAERKLTLPMWPYRVEWLGRDLLVAGHARTPAEVWRVDAVSGQAMPLGLTAVGPGISTAAGTAVVEQRVIDDNLWSLALSASDAAPEQVTRSTRSEVAPRISPDGTRLAYLADDSGVLDVFVQVLANGERRRISHLAPRSALDLKWSPDGERLALIVGGPEGKRLHVLALDGSEAPTSAAVQSLDVAQVDWSNDGRELLLGVVADGRRELRRFSFPGFANGELVLDASVFSFVRDESGLLFTQPRDAALYRLQPDGGTTAIEGVQVTATPGDQWIVGAGHFAQLRQIDRGSVTRLRLEAFGVGSAPARELQINSPTPPLGRNIDLGAGRLWYAQRDIDEADLLRIEFDPR